MFSSLSFLSINSFAKFIQSIDKESEIVIILSEILIGGLILTLG
jgi:hypothetical protein